MFYNLLFSFSFFKLLAEQAYVDLTTLFPGLEIQYIVSCLTAQIC